MRKSKPAYSAAFVFSILLHGTLIAFLIYGLASSVKTGAPEPVPEVIQATALDESKIDAEVRRLKDNEESKKRDERQRQERLEQRRQEEETRLAALREKHEAEEQRAKEREIQRREKHEAENQRLAELKKKQEEEQARLLAIKKMQEAAEEKRKEEEERLTKLAEQRQKEKAQREAEQKAVAAKAALEKQRQAEVRRKRDLAARRKAEAGRQIATAVASATDVIRQKVQRRWIRPRSAKSGMFCIIRVKLIPGGEVIDAHVIRSSGDAAFDRSVELAVLKSSPLPLPSDRTLFNHFRTFDLKFNPS